MTHASFYEEHVRIAAPLAACLVLLASMGYAGWRHLNPPDPAVIVGQWWDTPQRAWWQPDEPMVQFEVSLWVCMYRVPDSPETVCY